MKPVATQPVEQNISQVSLPTVSPIEKVVAPPAPAKNVVVPPSAVRPPTPPPGEEPTTTTASTEEASATEKKQYFGRPTAQIWIGNPPEDIRGMFPTSHREKIKDIRTAFGRGTNFPYAIVYFHSVEEASTAIEAINHSKLKFGEDYTEGPPRGNYAGRGGGSFSQGSYDARKTGGSDNESGRGGFGRGGRGGRGGSTRGAGSTGSFSSSRGTGSPARGGRGRGGGAPTYTGSKDLSASDHDKSETPIWQNDDKPLSAAAVSGSEVSEPKPLAVNPIPAPPQPTATSVSTAHSSTAGGESQSA